MFIAIRGHARAEAAGLGHSYLVVEHLMRNIAPYALLFNNPLVVSYYRNHSAFAKASWRFGVA